MADTKIVPLSEGTFTVDKTKQFLPFHEGRDELQDRPAGSLLVEIQPFLVKTSTDVLLFDTGLGFSYDGRLQLLDNLQRQGIEPHNITKVLLSHLHKDHSGGISMEDKKSGTRELSFPRARYYLQKREWQNALEKKSHSFLVDQYQLLGSSSQAVFLEDDEGMIENHIQYEVTAAHSPFPQVFWVKGDKIIFFGGDDAPQLQQMKHRFVAKYDYNGKKAMELRKQWWDKGQKEHWIFLFYHDVKNPVVTSGNSTIR